MTTIIPLGQKSVNGEALVCRGVLIGSDGFVLIRQTNITTSDFKFDAVVFRTEEAFDAAFADPSAITDWKVGVLSQFIGVDFVDVLSKFINFEAIY